MLEIHFPIFNTLYLMCWCEWILLKHLLSLYFEPFCLHEIKWLPLELPTWDLIRKHLMVTNQLGE